MTEPQPTDAHGTDSARFFFRSGAQLLCGLVFLHLVIQPGERDFLAGKASIGLPGYAGILLLLVSVPVARHLPGLFALTLRSLIPCGLTLASLLNVGLHHSLYSWIEILAGFAAWLAWVGQTSIVRRFQRFNLVFLAGNHLLLFFLFADWQLFGILHTHLNRSHLWWLRFPSLFRQGGVDVFELAAILGFAVTASFGLLWLVGRNPVTSAGTGRAGTGIRPPDPTTVAAVLICAVLQGLSFDTLVEAKDFGEYLRIRGENLDLPIPLSKRLRQGLGPEVITGLGSVDPRLAEADPTFTWTADARKPTIVFLVVESWRRDLAWSEMPLLREAASGALRFTRHFSNANTSSTAFFSLFRSAPPLRFVDFDPRFRSIEFTEFLKRSGYLARYYFSGYMDSALPIPDEEVLLLSQKGNWCQRDAAALDAIASLAADPAPKFLMSLLFSSHFPYLYPKEFARFSDDPGQESSVFFRNRYRNCLGFLDALLEQFRRRLVQSGADRRTIVVLVGDHGEGLGEATLSGPFFTHSNTFHTALFEVPLMIWAPGNPGRVVDRMTSHLDVLPTLGGLMGFRTGSPWGRNLAAPFPPGPTPAGPPVDGIPLFNWSAPDRVAWRTSDHQSVFRVSSSGALEWRLTTNPFYDVPPDMMSWYEPRNLSDLARRITGDAASLRRFLQTRSPESGTAP